VNPLRRLRSTLDEYGTVVPIVAFLAGLVLVAAIFPAFLR
jgi:hypothetical protein